MALLTGVGLNLIDKSVVRRSFDVAARYYDAHAELQRAVANRLMTYVERLSCVPARILDAGAGSGFGTAPLACAFPDSRVIGLDFSRAMLKIARSKLHGPAYVCGDIEALPFAPSTFDLVYSSSTLQWSGDLRVALREISRVMVPNATLLAAVYTAGTLRELRNSWSRVDVFPHTLAFATAAQLRRAFESAGFAVVSCRTQVEVVLYDSVDSLLKTLKRTGVSNFRRSRRVGLTTASRLGKMKAGYRARYAAAERIPASYVMSFVHSHRIR